MPIETSSEIRRAWEAAGYNKFEPSLPIPVIPTREGKHSIKFNLEKSQRERAAAEADARAGVEEVMAENKTTVYTFLDTGSHGNVTPHFQCFCGNCLL